jgi:hypothetical protein
MSLKDLFSNDPKRRVELGSGSDAVVSEYFQNEEGEAGEQETQPQQDAYIQPMVAEELLPEQQSEKFLNRMLKIQGLKPRNKNDPKTSIFDDSDFLEQIVLSSHDEKSAKKTWRRYVDNRDTREGDGNQCLANARDKSLLMRILLTRSLTDTSINANERALWVVRENRSRQNVTTTTSSPQGTVKGIFAKLFGS